MTTTTQTESTQKQPTLDVFFAPKTVAVIGADDQPSSVGRKVLWNLISSPFGGTVYPVNRKRSSVLGIHAYNALADVPEPIDLAVVVTPAETVPDIIDECVDAGVKGVIITSVGFKEYGSAGAELEQDILTRARRGHLRVIGPNCLGVMSPITGLNATFADAIAHRGNVGFISQSGALCTAILDWSLREHVGFSAFISTGSMLDVGWGELIDYLGEDQNTQSIVIYMESIDHVQSFLSAAREVALSKPIIVIKSGRTEGAAQAAVSHTGELAGSDEVLNTAFRRSGVVRVHSIEELFAVAEVLAKQPRPRGPRLTILTNAGGPGILAADALVMNGGTLAKLSMDTITALDEILPSHWSRNNPIDIFDDATPERYEKALEIIAQDANSDGLLVILNPQSKTDPTQIAERLATVKQLKGRPILASWMGGEAIEEGETMLNRANIPTFAYPDTAARAFLYMWQYTHSIRSLYETPTLSAGAGAQSDHVSVERIIHRARAVGRTILTEFESKQILTAYGIPTVETHIATSEDKAVIKAEEIGYPVVLKLHSQTITHKSDVGGVHLQLSDAQAVRRAYQSIAEDNSAHFKGVTVQPMVMGDGYELIMGSSIDAQFGPVILFGMGGQLTEIFQDRALALPPLTTTLARRMMERTRIFQALKGVRGKQPVDLAALEQLAVRFSQLIVEQRWIKETDINPLYVAGNQLLALDARIIVHGAEMNETALPQTAIRPYPTQYVEEWHMHDGSPVTIRPIRPEDEPLIVEFHATLSEQSVYMRFFSPLKFSQRTSHDRLTRLCFIDYDRTMALVVDYKHPKSGAHQLLAVGRLAKSHRKGEAEFSLLVSDHFQRMGLGTKIMHRLIQVGRDQQLHRIYGYILRENYGMLEICEKLGFRFQRTHDYFTAIIDI